MHPHSASRAHAVTRRQRLARIIDREARREVLTELELYAAHSPRRICPHCRQWVPDTGARLSWGCTHARAVDPDPFRRSPFVRRALAGELPAKDLTR